MKMFMSAVAGVLLFMAGLSALLADPIDRFGLRHFSLGTSSVYTNDYGGLAVTDLEFLGTNGLATELGAADSGAFFFPNTESVSDGYFMTANVYGSVSGVDDSLIGTVRGRRGGYATFYASADYSPLGATSVTFQVWNGNILVAEASGTVNEATMYAEYSSPPRVNPWWRQANGEYGASIEFRYPLSIVLDACVEGCDFGPSYYGNRIFIRPNGATGVVNSVSRTDVFGGGGLPDFRYDNVQLGMFARAHTALGPVKLVATNGLLTIDNLPPLPDDPAGVLVEFDHADSAGVHLLPIAIALANTNDVQERLNLSASGTWYDTVQFFGSASLENSNGVLRLSANFYAPTNVLTVYSNGVAVGTGDFPGDDFVTIAAASRVVAAGANAHFLSMFPGLAFAFESPATFNLPGGATLVGDRVVVSSLQLTGVADVVRLAIDARLVSSFTIVSETSTSSAPTLSITRAGNSVKLQWPDPAHVFAIESRLDFSQPFSPIGNTISYQDGIATLIYNITEEEFPSGPGSQFFRLRRYTYY